MHSYNNLSYTDLSIFRIMASLEAALTLLGDLPSKDRRACLEVLIRIFRNVVNHPDESKYRILKITNKTFNNDVWRHEPGRLVMVAAGWMIKEETVQLPSHVDLTLREKALAEKKKEMAALKKEMAERKAIAERIRAEHRRDIELKQVKQAAKAVPLGKGEAKKMSDMLPKNGGG
ncbi:putative PUB domain-containing protein [Homarus americanus]|uniref:Putative PUB domain-containing protein n=1 Tax=Homarus americanus TaxID=6706 RepID=A0A8J5K6E5_HOMAM|nr:putative PUB domain-containing protein [Homarus americanus]